MKHFQAGLHENNGSVVGFLSELFRASTGQSLPTLTKFHPSGEGKNCTFHCFCSFYAFPHKLSVQSGSEIIESLVNFSVTLTAEYLCRATSTGTQSEGHFTPVSFDRKLKNFSWGTN